MTTSERAEEALETMWIATQENDQDSVIADSLGKQALEILLKDDLVTISDGNVKLTERGMPEAKSVVRRHRLAERLLYDVLGASKDESILHEKACKFEHLLDRGLDDNICTLLGHPKICPHNKPIPPGDCCVGKESRAAKVVSPLSQLAPGQRGKVAYIHAPQTGKLQKLMAMGILPGAPLKLLQGFPSYVFAAGETQFAVDKEIADAIYIRLIKDRSTNVTRGAMGRRHKGHKEDRRFGFWR
jgi:DtxR family Mn-dependent transcriptional regulator